MLWHSSRDKSPISCVWLEQTPLSCTSPPLPCGSFSATQTADPHQSAPHQPSQLCCVNENQHHPWHLSAPAFSEALLVLFFFFCFFPDEGPELNTRLNKQATSAFIWCCKDLFISLPFLLIHNIHLFFFECCWTLNLHFCRRRKLVISASFSWVARLLT